jgi:dienelactone hydrolase
VGFATLLLDLLTDDEEEIDLRTRHLRFDIPLLAARLVLTTAWTASEPLLANVRIGYFGASTGAAAALVAAAEHPHRIAAVVSRGGRPDLAGAALPSVLATTLLIVAGADTRVLKMNQAAFRALRCEKRMEMVAAASQSFEEAGAPDRVAELARDWFLRTLVPVDTCNVTGPA